MLVPNSTSNSTTKPKSQSTSIMEQTPQVAIIPSPGMGHLIPLAEFAKRLVHHHHLSVTIIIPTTGPPPTAQKAVLDTLPDGINYLFLPPVSVPSELNIEAQILLTMSLSLPSLRDTLKSLTSTTCLVALITDVFGFDAFDVAKEFQVSKYLFFAATAMALSFTFFLPKLDKMVSGEFRDLAEPVKIPGCVPVHGKDLLDPVQDRSSEVYKWILNNTKRFGLVEGILVNTFLDLEDGAIKALQREEPSKPPIYPIGPLIQTGSGRVAERPGSECLQWLDDQPHGSVLFISFGSGGTLSNDQLNELALGLELSGQKFIWVVKTPNDSSANAAFFGAESQKHHPFDFLPKGFLDRTKGKGLVVPFWAPQIEILSHGSTGGFLTHCGWNSTLESVVHGVPLIAWPLYAEQKMNAVMLTEGLKVAIRPKISEDGLIGREEIAQVVKGLMEGDEGKVIRNRMKELKDAAENVLKKEGSSTKSLSELALKWKKNVPHFGSSSF